MNRVPNSKTTPKTPTTSSSTPDLPLFAEAARVSAQEAVRAPVQKPEPQAPMAWSVTELTQKIRGALEPALPNVWVRGEISNLRPAASGHVYFSLKDAGASISAAIFGWGARRPKFELRDGMEVLCHGKISVYPPRGTYQLVADQLEPVGAGALQLAFEQLKKKLAAEGLFDAARKRPLPRFPRRVAIVTSPSGAAIRDMLTVMKRRAPGVHVLVVPAIVQGDAAPAQIIRGIEAANRFSLGEVIVLARGGGSMEDLWCFNDESLARAIAASALPVVSAVGHEIDFTISDFVADLRAPTPSAAAEILTADWVDTSRRLQEARDRMRAAMIRELQVKRNLFKHISARLVSPKDRLRERMQRLDELSLRLHRAMQVRLERGRHALEVISGRLDALSPLKVLERGFSLVTLKDSGSTVVRSATQVKSHDEVVIRFHDGVASARITGDA